MNYFFKKITFIVTTSMLSIVLILTLFFLRGFHSLKNIEPTSPWGVVASQLENPFETASNIAYDPDLLQKYNAAFMQLQSNYEVQLWDLVEEGKKEYLENKDSVSIYVLGNKYLYAFNELEKKGDQEVENLLTQLTVELKQQDQDLSLIKDIEKYYKQCKQQKRQELFEQLRISAGQQNP